MLPLLKTLAPLFSLIAVVLLATRRRVIRAFEKQRAFGPDRAVPAPSRSWPGRWWIRRLAGAGVLQATEEGRYWIDADRLVAHEAARRRRALLIVATVMAMALAAILLTRR
jgi:hypothetical protein